MKLILTDSVARFRNLFVETKPTGPERPTKKLSPSGLECEVFAWLKLNGYELASEDISFENRGYAEGGSVRHAEIQTFLVNNTNENLEWVDVEAFVKENNLPFDVVYDPGIRKLAEKYSLPPEIIAELTGNHERLLKHHNNLIQFKLDGLVKWEGEYYIVEIKTVGDGAFKRVPLAKHQKQGIGYSFLLKVPRIIWIYENRSNFKLSISFQEVTETETSDIRNLLNKIVLCKNVTELNRITDCKYCRYLKTCEKLFSNGNVF